MEYRILSNTRIISLFLFTLFTTNSLLCLAKEGTNFTGTWQTNWGPITITQAETSAKGKYSGRFKGEIEGKVEGNRLRFRWFQPNGEWGRGYFDISADGRSFTGRWGGSNSDSDGGTWNGKKN